MSLQRPNNGNSSSSSSPKKHKTEESDEELLMVPDMEMEAAGSTCVLSSSADDGVTNPELDPTQNGVSTANKRRRGRNPVDKEYRSLKRLLRNRVSAQQARERKKVYVSDLESRANELQNNNDQLEEKISTLTNENTMLRKMLINTRPKTDDNNH
ncbi:transcription factor HY5-like isoform X1 [Capsella rubella]|uniref:transcription factor HY5-like isoform X1 n=1 Tax=Capsella rubella TaxID=81985 RepID=UPI000CD4C011|nr:transcription factor HY5-like isoform X1 [Capsella rubella]